MEADDVKRLKELEDENAKLKKLLIQIEPSSLISIFIYSRQ